MRPDRPPANLTTACEAGPEYPDGDLALGPLLDIVAGRETAAAICRDRHGRLVEYVDQVTEPVDDP